MGLQPPQVEELMINRVVRFLSWCQVMQPCSSLIQTVDFQSCGTVLDEQEPKTTEVVK